MESQKRKLGFRKPMRKMEVVVLFMKKRLSKKHGYCSKSVRGGQGRDGKYFLGGFAFIYEATKIRYLRI
jgi:hypothetical protein